VAALEAVRDFFEPRLSAAVGFDDETPARLAESMRYAVLAPGKRLRPALVFWAAQACGSPRRAVADHWEAATPAAVAVECIHAYSLVHDDLPAMDDDDLRRGRPTCHRQFDEATAILAGDSLQVLAFQLLAAHPGLPADASIRVQIIGTLAVASGTAGMAGGQALDLAAEGGSLTLADLERLHALKTGALIRASVLMAAYCCAGLGAEQLSALDVFGERVGLAFQVQDDILDVEGDVQVIGKPPGSDEARGMPTYPALVGLDAARARVRELHAEARRQLTRHGWADSPLSQLSDWLLSRNC
jgi:geranylgeranyl pyrophosphate synthase